MTYLFLLSPNSDPKRFIFIIIDVAIVSILHYTRKKIEQITKSHELEVSKKHDEQHLQEQEQQANVRAKRSRRIHDEKEVGKKYIGRKGGGYYKTNEKRSHDGNKQKHHIQQPSK